MDNHGKIRTEALSSGAEYRGTLIALTIPQKTVKGFAGLFNAAKAEAGLLRSPEIDGRFET